MAATQLVGSTTEQATGEASVDWLRKRRPELENAPKVPPMQPGAETPVHPTQPAATAHAEVLLPTIEKQASRSAVLDDLYADRSRTLDELRKKGPSDADARRRAHATKYLADLERYINEIEALELEEAKTAISHLDSLATKILAIQSQIQALPQR